ncbi:unnamed protein product [Rotaria sp. Silwood2]|nr:unnamed protein product [Rotaria sp. Silwood2]CAF2977773.1 unnamed protein product [Rotaria sp. Silwood2]CAF3139481.1 unnamed protein product [Rotaria sp. Silwood2]CAF3970445.1 unnamed protein product [Rotaria sp. Silwood2]CAF3982905.1 unnamed protein product [Rotaria sp. Silwood2]
MHIFVGYGNGTFSKKPTTSIALSSLPYSIAVGDFNNDSWLDIAVANHDHNNIGIFVGYDNGTFAKEKIHSTGASRPLSLWVHDFNNDKRLDIIVANDGTNNIGIFLGYGDGTFANQTLLSTGFDSLPRAVVVADFNNDDRPDIAVANAGINNIGVFLGNGDGSFSNQTTYSAGDYPVSLAVGDLNNDTRLDIVVCNSNGNNVRILLGNDDGMFTTQAIYKTGFGSYPTSVAVRDFNKDKRLDIIVANSGSNNIGLLLGNGDGTFEKERLYPISISSPQIVITEDLNNDTWIDIVVAIDDVYNVAVFLGGPDKNFTNLTTYPTGGNSYTRFVAVGDFNNDARLDIVEANYYRDDIGVFLGQGDGNFAMKIEYSTGSGSQPYSVTVGDFNNDARLDIVVANYGTNNVGIFLGNGNGNFLQQTTYSTGSSSNPYSVAVGDFNNDTRLDIVVANYGTKSIGIFLGNDNETFSNQTTYIAGGYPVFVIVGDLNNDARLDIVIANYYSDNVRIWFGNGDGTFSMRVTYQTGSGSKPSSVSIGDFNGDTRLDIVVANYGTNTVGVFLGNDDGTFSNQTTYKTDSGPRSVVVGDLNNDTHLDLIVANYGSNNIGVFLGNGDATFSNQTTYSTGWNSQPYCVAIGDFNNDNRLDVTVALYFYFSIGIFLGYYKSPFTIPVIYSSGLVPTPFALAVADFDNDTRLDIVAANRDGGNVAIYLNSANEVFPSSTLYSTGYSTGLSSVAVGDFNNDNRFDIVVTNHDSDNIVFFLGFGNGSFGSTISYPTGLHSGPCSVAVGDFNNDSRMDIVNANNGDDTIGLFFHYGFGAFMNKEKYSTASDKPSHAIAFGDFNKDTRIDMVVANSENSTIAVLLGNGKGAFSNQTTYSTGPYSSPFAVAVGDFNNDSRLDIAVANKDGLNVGVFLGNSDGTFSDQTIYWTGENSLPTGLAVGDFNNDARLDIVVTNFGGYYICVLLGTGDGTFLNCIIYPTGYYSWPWGVAVSDFNNDTQLDIAVANKYGFNVGVFLGNGDGAFLDQSTYSTGDNSLPIGLALGDFNNDSRIDIVVANYGSENIGVFLGNGDGSFMKQVTYSTGSQSGPYWVTVGDFNKDAQLDIAVVLSLSDTLAIYFGNENGTFSHPAIFGTGPTTYPWYLAVCDFNDDNWLDVAIVVGNVDGVVVFLGDKNRMFLAPIKYSTGSDSAPQAVAIGDFNNDKNLDVAVANSMSNNVGIFLGYGNGYLSNQITYSTGTDSQPWSVAVGDLNNDTRLDIVVTNRKSNNIGVFLGHGNGTFRNVTMYPTVSLSDPVSIAILDFNRDNKMDFAVVNYLANTINIFIGYGDGTFSNPMTYLTGYNSHPIGIVVGDFNMDNWMDIAVASSGTKNLKILLKLC